MKNQQKKYKKYLLLKKFKEDYEESSKAPVEEDDEYKGVLGESLIRCNTVLYIREFE